MSSLGDTIFDVRVQGPMSARKSWGPWDPFLGPTSLCVGPEYGSQAVTRCPEFWQVHPKGPEQGALGQ